MATIKLRFRASSVSATEGTLYYQVIHKRSVKWISTSYHIYPEEWDEKRATLVMPSKGERKAELQLLESVIAWEMKQRRATIAKLEIANRDISMDELCEAFRQLPTYKTVFTTLQELVARQRRMLRYGTAQTYSNAYQRFKEFREDVDLTFDQLTPDMIEEYEAWLTNRGLMQNTIRFYLRTLHTLLYKAMDKGLLSYDKKLFSRVRLSYVSTTKRAISADDVRVIQQLKLPADSILAFARDLFMFSFFTRGMSFVDIAYLKKKNLKNGLLTYCRKKTNQQITIAWEQELQEIVDRYSVQTESIPYMLPIIKNTAEAEYVQYKRVQENVNRALKRIGTMAGLRLSLTMYVARHSWASIARDMDISISIISEGMGHQSCKTTQIYLDTIDTSKVNEANRMIIGAINQT